MFIIRRDDGMFYAGTTFVKFPEDAVKFHSFKDAESRCRLRSDLKVQSQDYWRSYQFENLNLKENFVSNLKVITAFMFCVLFSGCGGGGGSRSSAPVTPPTQQPTVTAVNVLPANPSIQVNGSQQFTANVVGTNNPSQSVTWSVTGLGAITAEGLYTATGAGMPTVTATSVEDSSVSGSTSVTVTQAPIPLSGFYGTLVPSDNSQSLPLDFDLTNTNGAITSSPVLIIADSINPTNGCTNLTLSDTEYLGAQLPVGFYGNRPVITGSLNGQSISLSYTPFAIHAQPTISMQGTLSTDANGFQVIQGTYTSISSGGASSCFQTVAANAGTFTFHQYNVITPDSGRYEGNLLPTALPGGTPVNVQLTPQLIVDEITPTCFSSTPATAYEHAGRFFHIYKIGFSQQGSPESAWGEVSGGSDNQDSTLNTFLLIDADFGSVPGGCAAGLGTLSGTLTLTTLQ